MTDIRSSAAINAEIDAINKNAEATGTSAPGGKLTLLTLEDKAAKAIAVYEAALAKAGNSERYAAIAVGATVTFDFGRGGKRRDLTGTVIAADADTLAIQTGEGLDAQIVKVPRTTVKFED